MLLATAITITIHIRPFHCAGVRASLGFAGPHRNPLLALHRLRFLSVSNSFSPPTAWNPPSQSPVRPVSLQDADADAEEQLPSSAIALAAAIRRASPASPVEFTQRVEKVGTGGLGRPSTDFQRLCVEQLELFRMAVDQDAVLSVYVRPSGTYIMDRLELRRVACYPNDDLSHSADHIIVVGNFVIASGLSAVEASLSKQQVEFLPEFGAIILPMVKHPFVVGFLVAEFPQTRVECSTVHIEEQHIPSNSLKDRSSGPPMCSDELQIWEIQSLEEGVVQNFGQFTPQQRSMSIMIARSLAMAYVMEQKAMLLQQSSWQNNVRMSHLVEQIHGSLSSIRAISKMLSSHVKRTEIPYDIIEGILVQSDHMKDSLLQLQDAVDLTKANILCYNDETLKKMHDPPYSHQESLSSRQSDFGTRERQHCRLQSFSVGSAIEDIQMPVPLLLPPKHQDSIRPCTVSDVLTELINAAVPLANKQQRFLELNERSHPLQVTVEESALRQALSNLIEGALLRTRIGGRVEIYATGAPNGGVLIVIDDDGPDMHYMTQTHSLVPFGADLFSDGMVEENMTWNFVAGLTVARDILESYGCVLRVTSPRTRTPDGVTGTRVELWLPTPQSDLVDPALRV